MAKFKSNELETEELHEHASAVGNSQMLTNHALHKGNHSKIAENFSQMIYSHHDLSNFHFTYDYENGTGELYMRCGVALFSICAMIDRCLSLIQMVEIFVNKRDALQECYITFSVSMLAKLSSFLFIFLQTFFIFKYANIIINYGKNAALIGVMHIVCTNFCVCFRTIVHETVSEIRHHYHGSFPVQHYLGNSLKGP